MVKPLSFKGDKKSKKRKRAAVDTDESNPSTSKALVQQSSTSTSHPEDDTWVSAEAIADISGPIILVLPTDDPAALACDVNGKVFALALENIVDGDPNTAEPHDVRQVWIANQVAGTGKYSFKGHHGRYLTCDRAGELSATKEAVGPEEGFTCVAIADSFGSFAIQTERETFLGVDPAASGDRVVRGDKDGIEFTTSLRIRMQARFKPKLRVAKEERAREKISRKELEEMVGRRLDEDDVKMLKRARREGDFHEKLLDVKVKGKHDKFG
jgi:protein FRG1